MARPAIEKEKYVEAIEQMIQSGARLDEITATKLQKVVGGQYSRCVLIVDEYLASVKAQATEEETAPMPAWFKDFVGAVTQAAEGTWFKIASEMRKSVDELTTSFAEKRIVLEAQRKEDLQQIADLEAMVEKQDEALTKSQGEADQLGQARARVEGELAAARAEIKDLVARHTALEKEKSSLAADLKVARSKIEHLEKVEHTQASKNKELEALISLIKGENKELEHRAIVAETRTSDLEGNLREAKNQISKVQSEAKNQISKMQGEAAQVLAEAVKADKAAQASISTLEKQFAVATEKSSGLSAQVLDLKQQVLDLKAAVKKAGAGR